MRVQLSGRIPKMYCSELVVRTEIREAAFFDLYELIILGLIDPRWQNLIQPLWLIKANDAQNSVYARHGVIQAPIAQI